MKTCEPIIYFRKALRGHGPFLTRLFNLICSSFSVITACQKLPRLQFFDPLLKNLMAPKKNISWQWSQVEFCFTKKPNYKEKISLFLLTIAKKKFQNPSYYYFDLEPLAVFNSAQWNQWNQLRLYSSRKQLRKTWVDYKMPQ